MSFKKIKKLFGGIAQIFGKVISYIKNVNEIALVNEFRLYYLK